MQPEPPAGNHERARNPARFEPENAGARVDRVLRAGTVWKIVLVAMMRVMYHS